MPVYNGEPYLEAAIRSNLEQTFGDFELIISDNASTDRTEAICRDWSSRDARIRYIRNEKNLGAAANYNQTFRLAHGEYFRWSNADDVLDPRLLERTYAVLCSSPDAVVVYGQTCLIDASGRRLRRHYDNLNLQQDLPSDRYLTFFRQGDMTNAIYGLMRASTMRQTSLMGDGTFPAADVQFMASMVLRGKFVEIPEVLFFRRIHDRAMSSHTDESANRMFWTGSQTTFVLPTWRFELAGLRTIVRSHLPIREKARLLSFIAKRLAWRRRELAGDVLRLIAGRPVHG